MAKSLEDSYTELKDRVKHLHELMTLLIIVLFIGFAAAFIAIGGMVVNSEADRKASELQLYNQVQAQDTEIQVLTNQLKNSTVTPK